MSTETVKTTLAQELHERLRWFGRLRWLAIGALAVASFGGPKVGMPQLWPSLLYVASVVALYNLYFQWALRSSAEDQSLACRHRQAISEIALDLAALLATVHFTGGLRSPVLPFFLFHMAIGTMMLPNRIMYRVAAVTCLGVLAIYVAEATDFLKHLPIDQAETKSALACALNMITMTVTVFGTVYLAGRVSKQSKDRNIQLLRVTTELRTKTEELENALNEIHEIERRKSHYMRISAHQLRSPLGTIKTSLQVLTGGFVDPASKRGQDLLQGTVRRADALLAIVTDLLELAKIREGLRNAPWTPDVDLRQLLRDVVEGVAPLAEKREVRLTSCLDDSAVLAWGVPPDLRFAFDNIVHNAIRYSAPGGEVHVGLRTSEGVARIAVADHGIGIPEELQSDVFLEFVRAPNAKRHAPQGTGLGLSIVKEAVEMHGGSVDLLSQVGVGTTIGVNLRLRNALPNGAVVRSEGTVNCDEGDLRSHLESQAELKSGPDLSVSCSVSEGRFAHGSQGVVGVAQRLLRL